MNDEALRKLIEAELLSVYTDTGAMTEERDLDLPARAGKVMQAIKARDAAKEREQAFPFKETYDFLYNNHKDVLEELQEHIAELRRESDLVGHTKPWSEAKAELLKNPETKAAYEQTIEDENSDLVRPKEDGNE